MSVDAEDAAEEEFGDYEPDDAYAEEPADPEQVAIRVHELRAYLEEVAGEELGDWDRLTEEEKEIGIELGKALIEVTIQDPDNAPEEFHEIVAFFSSQPGWDELSPEAQEVAVALMDNVIDWLDRQGALPSSEP